MKGEECELIRNDAIRAQSDGWGNRIIMNEIKKEGEELILQNFELEVTVGF